MKKNLFKCILSMVSVLILSGSGIDVNAQNYYAWAKGMGSKSYDVGNDIAVDKSGNVYVVGNYSDTLYFGTTTMLTNAGGSDLFLAKYDAAGNELWIKGIGGTGSDAGKGIAVDDSGNVYITGGFSGPVDFDPGTGTALLNNSGGFLAKYDTNGDYLWAKNIGGDGAVGPDEGSAVAVDSAGNVYVTGSFSGTAHHGTITITATGSLDIYLAKYNGQGDCLWAKAIGDSEQDQGYCIAVHPSGDVYIGGVFRGTVNFNPGAGPDNLTSTGTNSDAFVARYNTNGDYIWAGNMGGGAGSMISAVGIAVDGAGNAFLTGSFTGTVDFNPGSSTGEITSTTPGPSDIFLVKYDVAGNYVWAHNIGGNDGDWATAVSVDVPGNVFIVGMFEGTADFDPGSGTALLNTSGSFFDFDMFLANVVYIQSPVQVNIKIMDITGQVILQKDRVNSISLKDLPDRLYLLQINDLQHNLIKMEKILKQTQ